ncbi:SUN domain protein Uth1 [Aspergillus sclerotialis]|uniref:SUN domain protein Uth1 n=1 Tax=Aspergillus sclerotialis TaxID=2070753 RepID=A0A3A2Z8C2_9EURO|nr:SUN domain protein Uth1 [Aspergillus sclerotialis]
MKFSSVALTLATAGLAVAQPHHHQHRHYHKRGQVVARGGPVVIEYELNGQRISADAVCKGIKEGTLMWADGHAPEGACEAASAMSTPTATSTPSPTPTPAAFFEQQSSSLSTPSPTPSTTSSTSSASTPASSPSSGGSSSAQGVDREFPDGQIDCGEFPSEYGAVALDYLGLGGYSGIQYITLGAMCSYACPPGYQKSQWPSTQGSTGQSVGGLHCKEDGKLYLTNPDFAKTLCVQGVGGVHVQNHLGEEVAVCRTDYPGTEAETIPLKAGADIQPLTCPDEKYYQWQGKTTSAQYYVNPKGYSTEKACQWGDGSEPIGNWAPINLGVGQNNGKWLSIFQNSPTTNEKLDYNVKIKGDNLSGSCRYENGKFYSETSSNGSGCTRLIIEQVEVLSGDAYFIFY